jgi:hypothetical protein
MAHCGGLKNLRCFLEVSENYKKMEAKTLPVKVWFDLSPITCPKRSIFTPENFKLNSRKPTANGASWNLWWFQTTNNCIQGHNEIVQRLGSHTSRGRYPIPIPLCFCPENILAHILFEYQARAAVCSYRPVVTEPSPSMFELIVGPMKNGVNLFSPATQNQKDDRFKSRIRARELTAQYMANW